MKIEFIEKEGAWIIEFITNSDFNLHLERTNGADDVYVYSRGSSEGEYKLYKRLFGRVIDQDIDIADNIVPKYFKVKSTTQPILCEITGDVTNITGQEVKPVGGGTKILHAFYHWQGYKPPYYDEMVSDYQVAKFDLNTMTAIENNIDGAGNPIIRFENGCVVIKNSPAPSGDYTELLAQEFRLYTGLYQKDIDDNDYSPLYTRLGFSNDGASSLFVDTSVLFDDSTEITFKLES